MFRPGQIAFLRIKALVVSVSSPTRVDGTLLVRDGLPLLKLGQSGAAVEGVSLEFRNTQAEEAYGRIVELEPGSQYRWGRTDVDGTPANVLVGKQPDRGSHPPWSLPWNSWRDPLFTDALEVVDETRRAHISRSIDDLKPLFRLQMAYLLLWSAIERYVSLRYRLSGERAMDKVLKLAGEEAFGNKLKELTAGHIRKVYRADKPGDSPLQLDPEDPEQALKYYYQVRNNIMHRGKGVEQDYEHLEKSLGELPQIFREVLAQAEADAAWTNHP
jgi:hypothetical protein